MRRFFALIIGALMFCGFMAAPASAEEVEPPPAVESFSLVQNGCKVEASYSYVREGVQFSQAFVAFRVDGVTVKVLESLNGTTVSGTYALTGNESIATINDLDSEVAYRTLSIDHSLCNPVTVVEYPMTPEIVDDPAVEGDAHYVLPEDTAEFAWVLETDGRPTVTTLVPNTEFLNGEVTYTYPALVDVFYPPAFQPTTLCKEQTRGKKVVVVERLAKDQRSYSRLVSQGYGTC